MAEWKLLPSQICPGIGNAVSECFWKGIDLLAFSTSGGNVIISTRFLHVIQILEIRDVKHISWSTGGKLACCSESEVFILEACMKDNDFGARDTAHKLPSEHDVTLRVLVHIKVNHEIFSCCWKNMDEHLVIGSQDKLRLYDISKVPRKKDVVQMSDCVWERQIVCSPVILAYSPDDQFLAYCGKNDRLVKIMYEMMDETDQENTTLHYFFLNHPRGVTSLQWRDIHRSEWSEDCYNVMITSCRDNVNRIWAEARKPLFTNSLEETTSVVEDSELEVDDVIHQIQFVVANVVDCMPGTILSWVIAKESKPPPSKDKGVSLKISKSKRRVKFSVMSEDWIIGVEPTGAIVVWGVQNLSRKSQRYPSIFIWNRLPPIPVETAKAKRLLCFGHSSSVIDDQPFLNTVNLYVLSQKGNLSSWRYTVRPYLSSNSRMLTGCLWGHGKQVSSVIANKFSPLLVSLDCTGRAIISRFSSTRIAEPSILLSQIHELSSVNCIAWIPNRQANLAILVSVSRESQLTFYRLRRLSDTVPFIFEQISTLGLSYDLKSVVPLSVIEGEIVVVGLGERSTVFMKFSSDFKLCGTVELEEVFVCGEAARSLFQGKLVYDVILGSVTGELSFWDRNGKKLGSFETSASKACVREIRCATQGRIATKHGKEIKIWGLEGTSPQFTLEYNMPCSENAVFDWLSLENGNHLLAVGAERKVRLLLETGSRELQSYNVRYSDVGVCSTLSSECKGLSFGMDGVMVVGTQSELVVFTKWLPEGNLFQTSDETQLMLPLHHPKILKEYMMGGHFLLVQTILKNMLESLEDESNIHQVIKPLSLASVINDKPNVFSVSVSGSKDKSGHASDFFSSSTSSSSAVDLFAADQKNKKEEEEDPTSTFTTNDCKKLSELLCRISIFKRDSKAQLHLLAIIDTFRQLLEVGTGLDASGSRFFIDLKMYQFLRKMKESSYFSISNWAWALQSEAQELLLQNAHVTTWEDIRVLGVPLWLKNPDKLKQIAENVAKTQFVARKDPFDCMLLYVALKRVNVLAKMFKMAKRDKICDFLAHDFSQERWQTAAMKNAYALMKQQKFDQAAAFFLVAGKLKDCLKLLLKHEKDYMLALFVARLYEGGSHGPEHNWVLKEHVLELAEETGDQWLASIVKWLLGDFVGSFNALLQMDKDKRNVPLTLTRSLDFNPVVVYYMEHLLAFSELVKCDTVSLRSDERLRRQTVWASYNAGCIYNSLDRFVNKAVKVEEKPVVIAAPEVKKVATVSDGGMLAFGMFDDGFGDMPLPEWAKPKVQPLENDDNRNNNNNNNNANNNNEDRGKEGQQNDQGQISNENSALCDEVNLAMDSAMKTKCALAVLTAICQRLEETCKLNWEDARSELFSVSEYLSSKLEISVTELRQELKEYCSDYHYVLVHFMLLEEDESRIQFFSKYSVQIVSSLEELLTNYYSLPLSQVLYIARLSLDLNHCYKIHSKESGKGNNMEASLRISVFLSMFFKGWVECDYGYLSFLLSEFDGENYEWNNGQGRISQEEEEEEEEAEEEANNHESGSSVVEKLVVELIHVLTIGSFIRAFCGTLLNGADASSSTMNQLAEKINSKYDPNSLEIGLIDALLRYQGDLLEFFKSHFGNAEGTLSVLLQDPRTENWSKWSTIVQTSNTYKNGKRFASLADIVLTKTGLKEVLKGAGIEGSTAFGGSFVADARNKNSVSFSNPVVLFQHDGMIQDFGIGTSESSTFILATSRGNAEVSMDEAFHVPKVLRGSAESSSATSASSSSPSSRKNGAPPIPLSCFIPKSEVSTCVAPHPTLPFYLSATVEGAIHLHQFGFPELLTPYQDAPRPRVHSIKFSPSGSRFGAVNDAGELSLWQFDSTQNSQKPFLTMQVHSKRANDLCFAENGNIVCTAGFSKKSQTSQNLSVWDTLVKPNKACVASFPCHEKGATSIVYSRSQYYLYSGGKLGDICVWDLRKLKLLHSFSAHTLNVRALDITEGLLVSGSSDGNIKVWSLPLDPQPLPVATFTDAHKTTSLMKNQSKYLTSQLSTLGVMHCCFRENSLFSSGADGALVYRSFSFLP